MFRTDPHANEARRERHLHFPATLDRPSQKLILNRELDSLNHTRRQLAPALDTPQIVVRQATGRKRRREDVGRATAS